MRTILTRASAGVTVAAALFALFAATAGADPSRPAAATAADGIEGLTRACMACHGRDGISHAPEIPNLAGQKQGYLVNQLDAFRRGERKNPLMSAIAAQLGDAQIEALATFWSNQPARPDGTPAPAAPIASRMQFPQGFPAGFVLYDTERRDAESQVVKRYANAAAWRAAQAGRPLPSGAAIIVETVTAAPGAAASSSYAGMESHAGWGETIPALLRNGDWDYALFGADRARRDNLNQASCLACHRPQAADSYLFTLKQLQRFANGTAR